MFYHGVRGRREKTGGIERHGWRPRRRLLLDLRDPRHVRQVVVRRPRGGLFPKPAVGVVGREGLAVLEASLYLPVRFGGESAALALALGDEHEGRALDTAYGEEGVPVALRRPRDPAGQGGAPNQVYILPRLTRRRELLGDLDELVEGPRHLTFSKRGEARPLDMVHELRVGLECQRQRVDTDKLALPVEVGRDHHLVGLLR